MKNKIELFDPHFTYQIIYDSRTNDELYSNFKFRSFVSNYYSPEVYNYNIRTVRNRWKKSSRIKSRLIDLLDSSSHEDVYFCTFTFNDFYISLPYLTLRTYVSKFMKKNFDSYVCNVDYGSLNGRLHFHAIASCTRDPPNFPYGFDFYEKIFNTVDNIGMASNYLNKLTNHSTKEKGRVLYSKDLRK